MFWWNVIDLALPRAEFKRVRGHGDIRARRRGEGDGAHNWRGAFLSEDVLEACFVGG
jgi:hypothetical protein